MTAPDDSARSIYVSEAEENEIERTLTGQDAGYKAKAAAQPDSSTTEAPAHHGPGPVLDCDCGKAHGQGQAHEGAPARRVPEGVTLGLLHVNARARATGWQGDR